MNESFNGPEKKERPTPEEGHSSWMRHMREVVASVGYGAIVGSVPAVVLHLLGQEIPSELVGPLQAAVAIAYQGYQFIAKND